MTDPHGEREASRDELTAIRASGGRYDPIVDDQHAAGRDQEAGAIRSVEAGREQVFDVAMRRTDAVVFAQDGLQAVEHDQRPRQVAPCAAI